jgi:hypothetical protein
MKKIENLENNKWVQRFEFWINNSFAPIAKVFAGYVLGITLVVLWKPDADIQFLGTYTNLVQLMVSFLVVFAFGFLGYVIMTFVFDMGSQHDVKNKLRTNYEAQAHLLHDKYVEEI